ncbi:hypothetical protein Tco_1105079 [Tanacetum coccineum]
MTCSLPHINSEVEALVQRLINEDKGRQDVLLNLAFQFEDSCAVRDDLRKAYEKCNDISQESRALICTFLKESSEKDRKLHLSMYGKAAQLEKQMDAKLAWFQEKYSGRTHGGIGCSSSQANCPLTEKDLHQLRMDEEALKEMLEEEAMNKKAQEEKIRQEQAENDAFFLEFRVVNLAADGEGEAQVEQNPFHLRGCTNLTNVASDGFKGSHAPIGSSKIYRRKLNLNKSYKFYILTKNDESHVNMVVHFQLRLILLIYTAESMLLSTPFSSVNTAEVDTAALNTGETERVQRRKGKDPMTEEDLQAEVQASKKSKELQELADLEGSSKIAS